MDRMHGAARCGPVRNVVAAPARKSIEEASGQGPEARSKPTHVAERPDANGQVEEVAANKVNGKGRDASGPVSLSRRISLTCLTFVSQCPTLSHYVYVNERLANATRLHYYLRITFLR